MKEDIYIKKLAEQEFLINQLQKEIDLKNQCLSLIAHDFSGVSRNLLWVLQALNDGDISHEIFTSLFPELKNNIQTNQKTIESTVAWVNSQHHSFKLQPIAIKAFELFSSIQASLIYNLKQKDISFIYKGDENAVFYSDPILITFIMKVIVENAIKYSYPGKHISFEVRTDDPEKLKLIIQDFGMGMSEQTLKNLFTLNGSPNTGTANEKGAGISLAIAYDFAKVMDIVIAVSSVENKGSTIELELPLFNKYQNND